MLKVLIVDDEILIRVGIKSCIDWDSNGFEVVGLAEDGAHAFELIEKLHPDIVLTDIKMPNMDGLELIEQIKGKYPEIRVIVLSCYNELDYIKKAIKMGADDYILKLSMQPEALLDVLNKIKAAMNAEKEVHLQTSTLRNEIRINENVIKEDLYKKLIDGAISPEGLVKELKRIGSSLSYTCVMAICAGIDDYCNASSRSKLKNRYLLKFSIINIFEEILSGFCSGDIIEIDKGEYLLILDFSGETADIRGIATDYCMKVNNALKNYLNINVSFGISELTGDFCSFKTMYTQAAKALEQKFYYGSESITFYNNELELLDKLVMLNFYDEKVLVRCLENLDAEGAKGVVDKFFREIGDSKMYHPSKVRMAAVEIFHSFIKTAKKFEVDEFAASEVGDNPVDMLMKAETILDIINMFDKLIDAIVDSISNKRLSIERPEILKLKQYVLERLSEDINLEMAAKVTNMSRSYLSTIFKKETGEAFTDYVNRLKMEEARELIQKLGLKTYEAAEKLGFQDESYFSKLFKKYIGISPSKVNKGNKE